MIGPVGRFVALRGFVVERHVINRGDPIDLTDPQLIADLLQAHKIEPRDDQTRRRVEWRSRVQWAPAPERTRSGYNPLDW